MSLTRRGLFGVLGGGVAAAGLVGCGIDLRPLLAGPGRTGELLRSAVPLPEPYQVSLPVPPLRRPVGGRIEITQRVAEAEILPGMRTPIFGYDGIFPGPTIETRRGQPVVVNHRNELPVPTVVHLHGGHTPAEHDGWPTDLVLPAGGGFALSRRAHHGMVGDVATGSRDYAYPNDQRAATLWYHDHRMDFTGPQVYRGLAGFHLIRDDGEDALGLPSGDREIPLMIADRAFEADGSFRYPSLDPTLREVPGVEPEWMEGVLGDVVLVNGAPWPVAEVDAARYRLRILNASNARRYRLALHPGGEFVQVGSDGGLLAAPVSHTTLTVAPAERFDVVVDFSAYPVGSEVTLTNLLGRDGTRQVMRFRVVRPARDGSRVPPRLSTVERLDPAAATVHREWRFHRGRVHGHQGWTINGRPFDPSRIDARPRLGDVELWRFSTDLHHPVHVHLDPFQIVSRGGTGPDDSDAGWKDTIDLRPAEVAEVAVRFTRHRGRFMMHCHNLEHEDMAMMTAFATTSARTP
ncbi:MAG: multicopper oxidase domain-containing protein [Pseudonocardiaceae bacterium]|nr:multicopper oxidase domain-containing protein [Pseudonocardiaceae bacterium]